MNRRSQLVWILQDRWRRLRSIQFCYLCRIEVAHNEHVRYEVYVVKETREFIHHYTCWACNDGRS